MSLAKAGYLSTAAVTDRSLQATGLSLTAASTPASLITSTVGCRKKPHGPPSIVQTNHQKARTRHPQNTCSRLLAQLEDVVVGDDDLSPLHIGEHVTGDKFSAGVVAVGIVGLENA